MEQGSSCSRATAVEWEFVLWLLEFCLDCERVVEFTSSLVNIILSCLAWNLSNLSRVLVNVQNRWFLAEALELSLKFWAGCLQLWTSHGGSSPTALNPQVPVTEMGFTGQARHCADILQLIHVWLKQTVHKEWFGYKRFWKQSIQYNLNVCKNAIL